MPEPIPLPRHSKDAERNMEKFFSEALSKLLGRSIPVALMWIEFKEIDIKDPPYHKKIGAAVVEDGTKNFHPIVAGTLVANVRPSGKIALVDGRHRREMIIATGRTGWYFFVTYGLSLDEEAVMFRWLQARKNISQAEHLRNLIISGDKAALEIKAAVNASGCCLPFDRDAKRIKCYAVNALIEIFTRSGRAQIERILKTCSGAWIGAELGFHSVVVNGMNVFLLFAKPQVNDEHLRTRLQIRSPDAWVQMARSRAVEDRCSPKIALAALLRREYNMKLSASKRVVTDYLDLPYSAASSKAQALKAQRKSGAVVLPPIPLELVGEIGKIRYLRTQDPKRRILMSRPVIQFLITYKDAGATTEEVQKIFGPIAERNIQWIVARYRLKFKKEKEA